jgi:hypothetical protein
MSNDNPGTNHPLTYIRQAKPESAQFAGMQLHYLVTTPTARAIQQGAQRAWKASGTARRSLTLLRVMTQNRAVPTSAGQPPESGQEPG